MITAIQGKHGSGKSSLAMTWPGKKFYFDLEGGSWRAAWRAEKKEYTLWHPGGSLEEELESMTFKKGDRVEGQLAQWQEIIEKYLELIRGDEYETIVMDTARILWRVDHKAELESKQNNQPPQEKVLNRWKQTLGTVEYGVPGQRMENVLIAAKRYNKHLILQQ